MIKLGVKGQNLKRNNNDEFPQTITHLNRNIQLVNMVN